MTLSWPAKDPDEVLDYKVDWTDRLDGDTISTKTVSVVSGTVVIDSSSITDTNTSVTVWLSGGTLAETAEILCRITTAGGRTMDQTVYISIRKK